MTPRSLKRRLGLIALLISSGPIHAQDGTWITDGGGDWSTSTNWSGSVIADGVDYTATFGNVISADSIINLDTNRTIGNITASDTGQNYTISGANTLTLDVTTGVPVINVTQSGRTLAISSVIAGNDGLQKTGAGILQLTGANTYSGGTTVAGGTIRVGNNSALGTGAVTVTADSTIDTTYGSFPLMANSLHVNDGVTLTTVGSTQYYGMGFTGAVTGTGTIRTASSGNNANGSSNNKLNLNSDSNTFTGTLINSGGSAVIGVNSLGDGGFIQLNGGNASGGFALNNGTATSLVFNTRQFDIRGSTSIQNNNSSSSNTITINTDFLIGSSGNKELWLRGNNTGNNTIAGVIADGTFGGDSQVITLNKENAGTWWLTGDNTYSGKTTIRQGTLVVDSLKNIGVASSLGTGSSLQVGYYNRTCTLRYVGAGDSTNRTIQINDYNTGNNSGGAIFLNDGSGALTFTGATFIATPGGAVSTNRGLQLGGTYSGAANEIQGLIQDIDSAVVSLTKRNDASTWVLSGNNTHTGTTTVSGGGLYINGDSSAATGAVSVAAGATLGGVGLVGGNTTLQGFLDPGQSPDKARAL